MNSDSLCRKSSAEQHRLLFISYAFPPTGGGGVQRSTKFAKYLPQEGWVSTILTVQNPSVPVQDEDLQQDLDPRNRIVQARTFEPSYRVKASVAHDGSSRPSLRRWLRKLGKTLLQPDPQILWNPAAYRVGIRAIRNEQHAAIFVTGPPFSSFLLGCQLKRKTKLPLILDFRDEWLLVGKYLENYQISGRILRRQQAMMRKALRAADAIVATTQASAAELQEACRAAGGKANAHCIYNGYDPEDFEKLQGSLENPATTSTRHLKVTYTGTLWELTDIGPFLTAVQKCNLDGSPSIKLVVAGRRTSKQSDLIQAFNSPVMEIHCKDYVPHQDALQVAAGSDVLLLLLADRPGAQRVVPAKVFEYLALNKTVLAIVPSGETLELIRQFPKIHAFAPEDSDAISKWISIQREKKQTGKADVEGSFAHSSIDPNLEAYSRKSLTKQLARILDQTLCG